MSETKAFMFLVAAIVLFVSAASVVAALTHANETLFGLVIALVIAAGGWSAGCIVMRYSRLRERHEREEILLRR
jgi:uncharacterized membrane protein